MVESQHAATLKGHLTHERQGLQSTKSSAAQYAKRMESIKKKLRRLLAEKGKQTATMADAIKNEIMKDAFPTSPEPNVKTNDVICAIIETNELHSSYFDTTGRFPQKSGRGNQYVMVGYHYDANLIWGIPMKDRTSSTMVEAWIQLHEMYAKAAVAPNFTSWIMKHQKI